MDSIRTTTRARKVIKLYGAIVRRSGGLEHILGGIILFFYSFLNNHKRYIYLEVSFAYNGTSNGNGALESVSNKIKKIIICNVMALLTLTGSRCSYSEILMYGFKITGFLGQKVQGDKRVNPDHLVLQGQRVHPVTLAWSGILENRVYLVCPVHK